MDPLMTLWVFVIGCSIGILIGVFLSYRTVVNPLQLQLEKSMSQRQKCGEAMKYYPYDPDNFHFIGSLVDGIQFEDDSVLFVLFRNEHTVLSTEQDRLKLLVENGKVRWIEIMV